MTLNILPCKRNIVLILQSLSEHEQRAIWIYQRDRPTGRYGSTAFSYPLIFFSLCLITHIFIRTPSTHISIKLVSKFVSSSSLKKSLKSNDLKAYTFCFDILPPTTTGLHDIVLAILSYRREGQLY